MLEDPEHAVLYTTVYLIERSLSLDNLFVFILLFTYFGVPEIRRARLLFWGIVAALAMRGVFILGGITLIEQFHFVIYLLGIALLVLAYRIFRGVGENVDPDKNLMVRAVRKVFPVTPDFREGHWFVKEKGTRYATPLFLCLVAIVFADLAFAIDSIPAAFAITQDGFLIWMGNVFALLGLRALFVLVEGLIARFRYLDETIAVVLAVVGIKLLAEDLYKVGPVLSLVIIFVLFAIGIAASLWADSRDPDADRKREERKQNLQPSGEGESRRRTRTRTSPSPSRLLLQPLPEVTQPGVPAPADGGHPGHRAREGLGGQAVTHLAALAGGLHQPRGRQRGQVLGHRLPGDGQLGRQLGGRGRLALAEHAEHPPPRGVGQRVEDLLARVGRRAHAIAMAVGTVRSASGRVSVTRSALPSPRSTISNSTREDSSPSPLHHTVRRRSGSTSSTQPLRRPSSRSVNSRSPPGSSSITGSSPSQSDSVSSRHTSAGSASSSISRSTSCRMCNSSGCATVMSNCRVAQ